MIDNKSAAKKLQSIIDDLKQKSMMQNSSCKLLKFYVRDLLDFQQIKHNKLKKDIDDFNLKDAIQEVVDVLQYQASRAGIPIIIEYSGQLIKQADYNIRTDSLRLQQVLLNLLSNAIKYTERGEIKIMATLHQRTPTEKFIRIAVKDTGLGISKKDQRKLFRLFGTIENDRNLNKKGIGLGLCICKMISTQFGGDIHVNSILKRGSIFLFEFRCENSE